jgi:hypothetical protein
MGLMFTAGLRKKSELISDLSASSAFRPEQLRVWIIKA